LPSGSIYYAGSSDTLDNNDIVVTKLDAAGNIIWKKTYGGGADEHAEYLHIRADGLLQVVGTSTDRASTKTSACILTIDTNGNKIRETLEVEPDRNLIYRCAQTTTDGGFIVTGYITQDDKGANDLIVVKYDAANKQEWTYRYSTARNEVGHMVRQTPDGGYVVTGDAEEMTSSYDMLMIKLSPAGEEEWLYRLEDIFNTGNQSVIILADGNYLLSGEGSTQFSLFFDLVFVKVNPAGKLIWAKTIGKSGTDAAFSMVENSEGNIILTGYTTSYDNADIPYNVFLGRMDPNADSVKIKYFSSQEVSIGYEIQPSLAGGYLIAATSGPYFDVIHTYDSDYTDTFYPTNVTLEIPGNLINPGSLFYPNPVSGALRYSGLPGTWTIYNATGLRVTEISGSGVIDTRQWTAGVYVAVSGNRAERVIVH
jgi:hypothetical protein